LTWEVDSVEYCNERPIATQQTGFSFVSQSRSWLPNEIGGIIWFGIDDAAQSVYYPIYVGNTTMPEEMAVGNGDLLNFTWESAFWIHNWVSNMVYNRYSDKIVHVQELQDKLESSFETNQPEIEKEALALYEESKTEAVNFLNNYSNTSVTEGLKEWRKMGEYMMVKYVDGVVKKEENGKFKRNEHGEPASPDRPGYPNEHYRKVIEETGDKYKVLF
jgi:dipeptidase